MKQNMEIISMDVKAFDALAGHVEAIERKAEALCRRQEDVSLKNGWTTRMSVTCWGYRNVPCKPTGRKGCCLSAASVTKIFYKTGKMSGKLLQSSHYPNTAAL